MSVSQLTVLGVGLIGGSICLGARAVGFAERIVAIDRSPARERSDVADHWVDARDTSSVATALASSELTLLCTPVQTIIELLPQVLELTPGWVSDCGSTKLAASLIARAEPHGRRFVPGHPMAGNPVGGLAQAKSDLFAQCRWILCPEDAQPEALSQVQDFVTALGATPVLLNAQLHDHSVAWTSHLPQVVASALSVLATEENARSAAGPGFASATRVAGGEPTMWRDIFETNGEEIAEALTALGSRLCELGRALEAGESELLIRTLQEARRLRGS